MLKRIFSDQFINEFPNAVYAGINIYEDAIIGVSTDGKIVYDFYLMHDLLGEDIITRNGDYENHFLNEDHFIEHVHQKVCKTISELEGEFGISAPIFCADKHFLYNVLPTMEENQIAYFKEEI